MLRNQLLVKAICANRYKVVVIKCIVVLAFILLAELRTCSAMNVPPRKAMAIAKVDVARKKTIRLRQRLKKQQHAVVNACTYRRKNKQRPVGFARYR